METVTDPISPADIDLEFRAELIADLEVVTVGDEHVVIGGPTRLVVLNPIAALIFQFLDGESSLGELVDDLAEALGLDREVVEEDVLVFVRELGGNGLLAGVVLPQPDPGDWFDLAPAPVLEPGDVLDDFTLPDLDDTERSLSDLRGKRVLLVNWSPGCGFCVQIAAELGA